MSYKQQMALTHDVRTTADGFNSRCPNHSRWIWGVRLRKHNVEAPSWRSRLQAAGEARESRRDAQTLE